MMQFQWLLLVAAILDINDVSCIKPVYLWPLGGLSGAREALRDEEVNHPLDTLYVGDGHPELDYRALALIQYETIEVNLRENLSMPDFTFSLYFFPMEPSGPVFTYQASDTESDELTEINVFITDAVLNINFVKQSNRTVVAITAHTVEVNRWNFLAFEQSSNTEIITVFNATSVDTGFEENVEIGNLSAGKIMFGSYGQQQPNLNARFTCAALYTALFSSLNINTEYEACIECQRPSKWPFHDTYTPDIREGYLWNTSSLQTAIVLPLNNVSFGFSSTGEPPVYPENSECFRSSDDDVGLLFDGSSRSYIEQKITVQLFEKEITIAMFLKPGFKTFGTVFQFIGESATANVELFLDGKDLMLTLNDDTSVCGTLKIAGKVIPGTPNYIITYLSKNSMSVAVNGEFHSNYTSCSLNDNAPTVSGRLLLGVNVNGGSHFRGIMHCFVVFNRYYNAGPDVLKNICQSSIFTPTGTDMDKCHLLQNMQEVTYRLIATDAIPSVKESPMMKVKHMKAIKCAKLCQETRFCLSFVVMRKSSIVVCHLYDFQTDQAGLDFAEKSKYFVVEEL